jgi:hypothetical protein
LGGVLIVIAERLSRSQIPLATFNVLQESERNLILRRLIARLVAQLTAGSEPHRTELGGLPTADVRAHLSSFVENEGMAYVVWMSTWEALQIESWALVQHYDELWLPGADDILMQPDRGKEILLLDHEEVLWSFGRRDLM